MPTFPFAANNAPIRAFIHKNDPKSALALFLHAITRSAGRQVG